MPRKSTSGGPRGVAPLAILLLALLAVRASLASARSGGTAGASAGACAELDRDPARAKIDLASLGRDLTSNERAVAAQAQATWKECTLARSAQLGAKPGRTEGEVEALAALLLIDPERFVSQASFRQRVLDLLPEALDPRVPTSLRDDLLAQLNQIRGFDFAASDRLEVAWGRAERRATSRKIALPPSGGIRFDVDTGGRIATSIFSLPSLFFDSAAAGRFLEAVGRLDPEREILVLTDPPLDRSLAASLAPLLKAGRLHLLETFGRPYTPWPRDPFSLVRSPSGRLIALARPNLQPGREEDANLAAELVQNLPAELDRRWGGKDGVAWAVAPAPFHNGQVLLTPTTAWMTLHALEPRVLSLLGVERIPVDTFSTSEGIDRYLAALAKAQEELAALYGRTVRFIHPLPTQGPLADRTALLRTLGGAAGYDLDSLLTLAPQQGHGFAALVADPRLGRSLVAQAGLEELAILGKGFGLGPEVGGLRSALLAAQDRPDIADLAEFLDLSARYLSEQGLTVRRLPLLSLPVALLRDREGLQHPSFLLTWNNVVVEERGGHFRAAGFSYLFPPGDRAAQQAFAALDVRLDLLPPLIRSIVLNGGYRCASNHLRSP